MALTVNTNLAALTGLRNLNHTNRSLNASFQHISSGLRITKAADDHSDGMVGPAADAVVEQLKPPSPLAVSGKLSTSLSSTLMIGQTII